MPVQSIVFRTAGSPHRTLPGPPAGTPVANFRRDPGQQRPWLRMIGIAAPVPARLSTFACGAQHVVRQAGDLVDEIQHDALSYDGTDISLFEQTAKTQRTEFAGGEHAWDLITNQDQPIATGLYIYSVEDNDTGEIYTGKFLVIK